MSVASYAALGRSAPAPRRDCVGCSRPMAFDGSYPRQIREAGVVHRVFVRRAYCRRCDISEALLPDFVLYRRRDSTSAVGAAVLAPVGVELPDQAAGLYRGVPERTVRSWRQRFALRADELWLRFEALAARWGEDLPWSTPHASTPSGRAIDAMGLAWRAARRRPTSDVPPAWRLANVIVGSQLISTRIDLPWPIVPALIGRARAP
ncbi:MAG: DUF6431 domain-containing protein [Mycobacteriales bacterium]